MIQSSKPKQYCKNTQMIKELELYHKHNIISEKLGKMFMDIATRLTGHSYFRNYPQHVKDDLMSYALEKMVVKVDKFDLKYKNPFSYFTQIAFNAFLQSCKNYYKHINIRKKIANNYFISIESSTTINQNNLISEQLKEIIDS